MTVSRPSHPEEGGAYQMADYSRYNGRWWKQHGSRLRRHAERTQLRADVDDAVEWLEFQRNDIDDGWDGCDTDDYTPAEIAAVIAEAEASGAVVWPEHVPMPELRDLKFLPWERARTMGFPFNVPNGADEEG